MSGGRINPRDVEPMSPGELNTLSNRLIGEHEGRPWRTTEGVEPPYEPNLDDTVRLLRTAHDLSRFKGRDDRRWHEEMFRRSDAEFFRGENKLLHATMITHSAEWMAKLVRELLDEAAVALPTELRDHLAKAVDAYEQGIERDISLEEVTFIDRLRAVIADEEVRQGMSTGETIGEQFRAEEKATIEGAIAKMKEQRGGGDGAVES